jgi:hypothetical protein
MDDKLSKQIAQANAAFETLRSLGFPKPEPIGERLSRAHNLAVRICLESYLSNKTELFDKGTKTVELVERLTRIAYAIHLPMLSNGRLYP